MQHQLFKSKFNSYQALCFSPWYTRLKGNTEISTIFLIFIFDKRYLCLIVFCVFVLQACSNVDCRAEKSLAAEELVSVVEDILVLPKFGPCSDSFKTDLRYVLKLNLLNVNIYVYWYYLIYQCYSLFVALISTITL